jgi:hypothetical protein
LALGFARPSAYKRAGYINNGRHDFGNIVRFVEPNFGIREGALHFTDSRAANNLTAFYDLTLAPRTFQNIQAPKGAFFRHDKRKATDPDDDGDGH